MKIKKTEILSLYLAFIHFIISFFTDKLIFNTNILNVLEKNNIEISKFYTYKLCSLLVYIILYQIIIKIIANLIKKDKKTKEMIIYWLVYLSINAIILLLTWPGIWRWDEFNILYRVSDYSFYTWQNYLTSLFYIISYMIIPIPSGVIIIQIICASAIVSYIIYNFKIIFKDSKLTYLLYLPFILLPVLDHNLYPLRLSLYSYIELMLICQILFMKKREINKYDYIVLSAILVILVSLRSEGKVFILLIPIIYLLILKKEIKSIRIKCMYMCFTIIVAVLLILPQDYFYKKENHNRYEVTSYINQLYVAIRCEMKNNPDCEEIKTISRTINIDRLLEGEKGIVAHNIGGLYIEDATKEDYENLKKASIKLISKYPFQVLEERIWTFLGTSGFINDINVHVEDTRRIYDNYRNKPHIEFLTKYRKDNITNKS
ncbi:MAG: hypothetical protein IKG56_05455 [Clostridia bacterium]|nr:hypothetical protein [Clostridia bacterium]